MRRERLLELMERFGSARVIVFGDLFLDKWLDIDPALDEPSVETGLPAHQVVRARTSPGAAGTVLCNLAAMGAGHVEAVSLIGDDGEGYDLLRGLDARGVRTDRVLRDSRVVTPTYMKPMLLKPDGAAEEQSRLDIRNHAATPDDLVRALSGALDEAAADADAVMVLDQLTQPDTGVVTGAARDTLTALAARQPGLLLYADSRAFIDRFSGVMIKCNDIEAARVTGRPVPERFAADAVFAALSALRLRTGRPVFVSCGAHGVAGEQNGEPFLAPAALQRGEIDVCGAGDACSAGIVLALCAGATQREAAEIGNLAAGVTVRKLGVTGDASRAEMIALYDEQPEGFGAEC